MRIICATNMPFAKEAFGTLGDATILEGRAIDAAAVRDADLLALRSTTKVGRALLEGSRVRFVGTATIGTDHFDIDYLESAGVRWCYAPGCNANSVSEYVTAALLCLGRRHGITLEGKTLGVIGVGNVGRRVIRKAQALRLRVLRNDPPRERDEGAGEFVSLERLLAEADIVTLHVPLTYQGVDATFRMAGDEFFRQMKPGAIFLNAARGGIVQSDALLRALDKGVVAHVVLDTWEHEPAYFPPVMARADLATPHIAGHSFEGRVMGTVMVYREACRFLGVPASWSHEPLLPSPLVPRVEAEERGRPEEEVLEEIVRQVYEIEADDRRFRATCVPDDAARAAAFDRLRREYPERREFPFTEVSLRGASEGLRQKVLGLGFRVGE